MPTISSGLINELQHEMANTRKMLERVPMEKADWKPHEKSKTIGSLATHIARLPSWITRVIILDEFDVAAPNAFPKLPAITSNAVLLDELWKNVAESIKSLEGATDEIMLKPWTFRHGEHKVFTLPKVAAIRDMGLSHLYHHRGQMSVYLRLLNIPVPGMYGPSADETR